MTQQHGKSPSGCDAGGYVLIYRRLLDHTAFRTDAEAMAFAWMVLRASWRDVEVRYKDRAITLKRGQLAMSVRDMATHLERSKDWANRFLARLTDRDMVRVETATGVTIISINNYNSFQLDPRGQCDTTATGPRQDRDRTATQNNEVNEGNERKEEKREKKDRWTPPDWIDVEAWKNWETYRREIKKPLTDRARAGCVKVLEQARDAGFPVKRVIEVSIDRGWTGLFVPKGEAPPKYPTPPGFKSRKDWIASRIEMLKSLMEHGDREKYIEEFRALRKERDAQWT